MLAAAALACVSDGAASPLPQAPSCRIFPASSPWNQRVDRLPVAPGSDRLVASIGLDDNVHADFGSGPWNGGPIGIPVTVVPGTQPNVRVAFEYASESDEQLHTLHRVPSSAFEAVDASSLRP